MIETVGYENKEAKLTGDLNCNYLVHNDHNEIKEILYRDKLKQLIKQPTRITETSKTLIEIFPLTMKKLPLILLLNHRLLAIMF